MAKKVAFLTIHGMGDTDKDYYAPLKRRVKNHLGDDWNKVAFKDVFFQKLIQDNQEKYFKRVRSRLDWLKIREFLLFGFSDAGGLEYSRTIPGGIYTEVQRSVFKALGDVWTEAGQVIPVVFIAQSLGGQVLSNYIWDAGKYDPDPANNIKFGIWSEDHSALPAEELLFRQLKSLKVFMTTGCNIPIFVAGLKRENIEPIQKPNDEFIWENYFDADDTLGWPLQDLSDGYDALVQDKIINAGGFLTSWTPISHTKYWTDKDVVDPLVAHIKSFMV